MAIEESCRRNAVTRVVICNRFCRADPGDCADDSQASLCRHVAGFPDLPFLALLVHQSAEGRQLSHGIQQRIAIEPGVAREARFCRFLDPPHSLFETPELRVRRGDTVADVMIVRRTG
jgi:hypothetical protein